MNEQENRMLLVAENVGYAEASCIMAKNLLPMLPPEHYDGRHFDVTMSNERIDFLRNTIDRAILALQACFLPKEVDNG